MDGVSYDRAAVAAHATNLANKVKGGLENSLKVGRGRGVTLFHQARLWAHAHVAVCVSRRWAWM